MPRALRGYQHVDYTALLNQLNGTCEVGQKKPVQVVKAKEKKSASNVSPEKRRRDSLMADNRMRYAYSASDNVIHDRDCSKVSGIKDSDFRMSEEFLLEKKRCKECYRRAVIRAGVRPEEAKYIYAYVRTLTQLKAQTADLVELFIRQKAVLQRAEPNAVCVKVNDDNWKICRDGDELFLFHNNYIRLPDYSRIMGRDFHLHQEVKSFGKCIPLMCSYSWENHVKRFKREDLSARLQDIANYERVNRFSLFYSYFYIVDWKKELKRLGEQENINLRVVLREQLDDTFSAMLCKVPHWKRRAFHETAMRMKRFCVSVYCPEYADHCMKIINQKQKGSRTT